MQPVYGRAIWAPSAGQPLWCWHGEGRVGVFSPVDLVEGRLCTAAEDDCQWLTIMSREGSEDLHGGGGAWKENRIMELLSCWNQNVRREWAEKRGDGSCKDLEIEVIHSSSDNTLESIGLRLTCKGVLLIGFAILYFWASCFNTSCFSFLICKMVIIVVPTSLGLLGELNE